MFKRNKIWAGVLVMVLVFSLAFGSGFSGLSLAYATGDGGSAIEKTEEGREEGGGESGTEGNGADEGTTDGLDDEKTDEEENNSDESTTTPDNDSENINKTLPDLEIVVTENAAAIAASLADKIANGDASGNLTIDAKAALNSVGVDLSALFGISFEFSSNAWDGFNGTTIQFDAPAPIPPRRNGGKSDDYSFSGSGHGVPTDFKADRFGNIEKVTALFTDDILREDGGTWSDKMIGGKLFNDDDGWLQFLIKSQDGNTGGGAGGVYVTRYALLKADGNEIGYSEYDTDTGTWGNFIKHVVLTIPGAPTIGTAVAGDGEAVVHFTSPNDDGGDAITSYTVTSDPDGITATGASIPIIVDGLTNGITYTFTVVATNSIGDSFPSAPSNAVTPIEGDGNKTVPDAPTIGTAVAGDGQATVSFTAPSDDGGAAITSYTVISNPDGITATGASIPIIVDGLTNGTTYTFTVVATNSIGNSSPSTPSNPVTPMEEYDGELCDDDCDDSVFFNLHHDALYANTLNVDITSWVDGNAHPMLIKAGDFNVKMVTEGGKRYLRLHNRTEGRFALDIRSSALRVGDEITVTGKAIPGNDTRLQHGEAPWTWVGYRTVQPSGEFILTHTVTAADLSKSSIRIEAGVNIDIDIYNIIIERTVPEVIFPGYTKYWLPIPNEENLAQSYYMGWEIEAETLKYAEYFLIEFDRKPIFGRNLTLRYMELAIREGAEIFINSADSFQLDGYDNKWFVEADIKAEFEKVETDINRVNGYDFIQSLGDYDSIGLYLIHWPNVMNLEITNAYFLIPEDKDVTKPPVIDPPVRPNPPANNLPARPNSPANNSGSNNSVRNRNNSLPTVSSLTVSGSTVTSELNGRVNKSSVLVGNIKGSDVSKAISVMKKALRKLSRVEQEEADEILVSFSIYAAGANSASIRVDKNALRQLLKASANLEVETPFGTFFIDNAQVEEVLKALKGSAVILFASDGTIIIKDSANGRIIEI